MTWPKLVVGGLAVTGGAAALFAALRVTERATHRFLHQERQPLGEVAFTPDRLPESVTFPSADGLRISAWYFPSRNGAAVIVCHGLGGNRVGVMDYAEFLSNAGYGVLLFDFRAHGESEGEAISMGYFEALDVAGGAEYLKGRADVDDDRVGVLGVSLGGSAAVLAAAQCPDIRSVVVDSTFATLHQMIRHRFRSFINLPTMLAPLVVWYGQRHLQVKASLIAPALVVADISPRPVFIIHGTADELIPVENGHDLFAAAREPKDLWILPDSPHASGITTHRDEYIERVTGFFNRTLQPRPSATA